MVLIKGTNPRYFSNNLKLKIPKWWIEINTAVPRCSYYFGPFDTFNQAVEQQDGYIQDLIEEGAREITIDIKKGSPQQLTIEGF